MAESRERFEIRYLGIRPDKVYVFNHDLLKEFPQLRIDCCDHYDLEELLKAENVLEETAVLDTSSECLYVYFENSSAAKRFVRRLNEFIDNFNKNQEGNDNGTDDSL
jgi:hypothetical protein